MAAKTCLECKFHQMADGQETGRTSLDFCQKKDEHLPTAAFCFDDTCCPAGSGFNPRAFSLLEEIAEKCILYEKK